MPPRSWPTSPTWRRIRRRRVTCGSPPSERRATTPGSGCSTSSCSGSSSWRSSRALGWRAMRRRRPARGRFERIERMPNALVIYMVAHQPRRIRLPAQLIPRGTPPEKMDALIFDDQMDRRYFDKVAKYCYRPATELFQSLVEKGMKISLGFSVSFLVQMRRFSPDVLAGFQKLVSHENVELVAVEPYHSFIFYLDIAAFADRMAWGKGQLEDTFQKRIAVTDATEMFMSNDVYFQLHLTGSKGTALH